MLRNYVLSRRLGTIFKLRQDSVEAGVGHGDNA